MRISDQLLRLTKSCVVTSRLSWIFLSSRKLLWLCAILSLTFFLASCGYLPFGYDSIADIQSNPAKYEGREVRVKGTVFGCIAIPYTKIYLYLLKSDGSEITVVSDSRPITGEIKLVGIVTDPELLGLAKYLKLVIRETKRDVQYMSN